MGTIKKYLYRGTFFSGQTLMCYAYSTEQAKFLLQEKFRKLYGKNLSLTDIQIQVFGNWQPAMLRNSIS